MHTTPGQPPAHTNRLSAETSPYLLQHAHNPVDWYPWGPEALERAKAEDRPILLSIGYAACHWCHVMAHESFEDPAIARLMNAHFINIKVDREERPDLDALYMQAVQALTGQGGWPMTVFLLPDGAPFYGGTYFPPVDRHGMPGFGTLLRRIADLYATHREQVEQQAAEFRTFFQQQSELRIVLPTEASSEAPRILPEVLNLATRTLLARHDALRGGFGRAPKFPHPLNLEFLLRMTTRGHRSLGAEAPASAQVLAIVQQTLDAMANGGIYDQVGGGFHRYATDTRWLVPHFEKMLYDNALLAPVYLHAWQVTGEVRYRRICEETLDFTLREMRDPAGGFYSTLDADSEGEEGRFYVWELDELRAVLGPEDAPVAERVWGVTPGGNFEGHTILSRVRDEAMVAQDLSLPEAEVHARLARARERLYAVRAQRTWPGRDDKVLAAWNGLHLRALAEAARAVGRRDYLEAAEANATFLTQHLMADGRLLRSWRQGQARITAYLEDYAAVANGLLSLYEATGDANHFAQARRLADDLLDRFWDAHLGAFFDTATDHETLIGRPRELTDGATPSGTSLAVELLLRLHALTGEERYRNVAEAVLVPLAASLAEHPLAFGHLLCALDDLLGPLHEVALVGPPEDPRFAALAATLDARYLPRTVVARTAGPPEGTPIPLLADRTPLSGAPTAYVCAHFVCQAPTSDPATLLAQLTA